MTIIKPYRRTCRQFLDGDYSEGGRWMYLLHKRYATDPRHYVRAFLLIQEDIFNLFSYIEPSDQNINVYSHKIQQILMRTCVEIEANFTAIFLDNKYTPAGNTNIVDYRKIDKSHRLSSFEIQIPIWQGSLAKRAPFKPWTTSESLTWYQAYNKSKHQRHENFKLATFDCLIDAFCALNILLSAQFFDEDYASGSKSLALEGAGYYYDGHDGMDDSIGGMLRIKRPRDWPLNERYDFDWSEISSLADPFQNFDYSKL